MDIGEKSKNLKLVYFGGEPIGVPVLKELLACGLKPSLVVCNPDRPAGRGQQLTAPPVKVLAEENEIEVWQPTDFKNQSVATEKLADYDLFVVVAYNRILPKWLIELPKHQTINVHPSLLPLRRGANPIRSAIVEDDPASIGVSIMLMDEAMDHGPILTQKAMEISDEKWPVNGNELDLALANLGGAMLADTIPKWTNGETEPQEQNHEAATYTKKVFKSDGELKINPKDLPSGEEAHQALLKIHGYAGWPGTYFIHNGKRIKINQARIENNQLVLENITPEGKAPMSFNQWLPKSNR